jgi:DNA-binding response OmpR family regulator
VTGGPDSPRVLVVDDAPEMRAAICRVLGSGGYRVDAVGTLAQARAMTPGEYDAVLVDMRLGSEQGTTLITELIAADPELAGRCLLMSGGLLPVSSGVAALAKPFTPGQLLDAVRALCGTNRAAAASAGPEDGPSVPAPSAAPAPTDGSGPASTPLRLSGLLRERERAAVADAVHDGPVQDLASALLGLHLIRGQLPATQTELLDSVAGQVSDAATALRGLIGRLSPPWPGEPPADIIGNQTAWLLAGPPAVEIRPPVDGLSQKTARLAADVAELALFLAAGVPAAGRQRPSARIRVLEAEPTLDIETTVSRAAGDLREDEASVSADTAWRDCLRTEMESALGADIGFARRPGEFRVRVSLRGRLPARADVVIRGVDGAHVAGVVALADAAAQVLLVQRAERVPVEFSTPRPGASGTRIEPPEKVSGDPAMTSSRRHGKWVSQA